MTTIKLQLPDDLAQDAHAAGLLTHDAIKRLLCERLKSQSGNVRVLCGIACHAKN